MKKYTLYNGKKRRAYCECDGHDFSKDQRLGYAFGDDPQCPECDMFPWILLTKKEKEDAANRK